jgi:dihydrofolate synthase/folylpolyglutamate synthase
MGSPPAAAPELSAAEARAFWYGLINYEQRPAVAADLKLEHMRALLGRLGDPHRRLRILHVAGTKGKGSTAAMLASILRRAGYRSGLFTSPHLCQVEERFQVDGQPISADELTVLLNEVAAATRSLGKRNPTLAPTFFEVATAVGFLHFVRRRVDVAVVEVGLGGRFDSTNVCLPQVALITSISYDHTMILGDRLASIAREKAGIIKPRRPTLSGSTLPEARAVIQRVCQERRAPLRQLEVDFRFRYQPGQVTAIHTRRPRVQVVTERRAWPWMELNLLGEHQAANAALVLACVEELHKQGWHLPDQAVAEGLAEVQWPARMEVLQRRPLVVLDCAHNVASAHAVVQTLQASFAAGRRILLFAGSSDKDLAGMLRELAPHFDQAVLTRFTTNARAVPPEQLADWMRICRPMPLTLGQTPAEAWRIARQLAGPDDLICITGSIFLAGELRPLVCERGPS